MKKLLGIILLTVMLSHSALAQVGINQNSNSIKFKHLTMKHGLSSNFSLGIIQDSQGFIWFGTKDGGVNKYDGAEFTTYVHDPDNSNSLSNNFAFDFVGSRDGMLWICTGFSETMTEEIAESFDIKGFLLKPIVMKDLSHKIREVLDLSEKKDTLNAVFFS